jgi:hypothetical protein
MVRGEMVPSERCTLSLELLSPDTSARFREAVAAALDPTVHLASYSDLVSILTLARDN